MITKTKSVDVEATVDVDVDIELSDFENDELVDFICEAIDERRLTEKEIEQVVDCLRSNNRMYEQEVEIKTLDDEMKYEHLMEIFHKYTLTQIEAALPK